MSERLSDIRLVLHEPLPELGDAMASMLRSEGFAETEHVHTLETVRTKLMAGLTDVLLLEADGVEADCAALIRALRRIELGPDPFVCTIVAQSDVTPESLARFSLAGADWILDKPYSAASVLEHIRATAKRPRHFVVSGPYAGPEHRREERPGVHVDLLNIPNTLHALMRGDPPDRTGIADAVGIWRRMLEQLTG